MQLRNPGDGTLVGSPIPMADYTDQDLGRRLRRRGWANLDEPDYCWIYRPSLDTDEYLEDGRIQAAAYEQAELMENYRAESMDWHRRADEACAQSIDEATALVGPQPIVPPALIESAEETFIGTGDDGLSYDVAGPGFRTARITRTYTDRHQLLVDLDDIEAWLYQGSPRRVIAAAERSSTHNGTSPTPSKLA
ncbi:hypothetical protein F1D05_10905 [Kribbella qitaiheensis]|uniref:Uncharacterized protein n=1 Tax=Kribbella qitaiheensis TaxID=1544730 RepID=A0A7G6WWE5_9ACTN|nr:hypothetical protein [Kribbella qitaiheensis]QNE18310.1 hypothetical protein F1D05_10905 [Kribbella qitaiheensis]